MQILDDDFLARESIADGASNVETVDISQPGLGAEKFRIDTSPQVAILTFPDRQVVPLLQTSTDVRLVTVTTGDDGGRRRRHARDQRAVSRTPRHQSRRLGWRQATACRRRC